VTSRSTEERTRASVVVVSPRAEVASAIVERLQADGGFEIAAVLECDEEAIEVIRTVEPDGAFLTVESDLDGFRVAQRSRNGLATVYVSSEECFASRAFEEHAVDYLVIPLAEARIDDAIRRLTARLNRTPSTDDGKRRREGAENGGALKERYMAVKQGRVYKLVDVTQIRWAEAARNYVRLHTDDGDYLCRMALTELEARLDPRHFVRVHRSTVVNARRIRRIVPLKWGDCTLELDTGEELRMSRTYRSNLL